MKKLLSVLSVLLVAVMLLTACSKPANNGGSTTTSGNSEYAGIGEGKTLVYWCEWNESETQWEVYKDTIARFEADTGYTVQVEHYGRDISTLYAAAIDNGKVIDIFDMNATRPKEGYCVDIDAKMEELGVKDAILPIYDNYEKSVSPFGDDKWYAVPSQPFFGGVFYNKDIFDQAGITELPTTWDEFMDACEKIKAIGVAPMTIDDAYVELLITNQMCLGLGGQEEVEKLVNSFGDEWNKTLPVIEKFQEMYEKGYFASTVGGNQFPAAQNGEFAMGTAAMYFDGSWVCNEVHDITGDDFNWGFLLWPSSTTDEYKAIEASCQQICVSPTSQDVDGACLLLKYMIDAQTCVGLRDKCQCIPVVDGVDWPAALADVKTMSNEAELVLPWNVYTTNTDDVTTLMRTNFHKVIGGTMSAKDFVASMVAGK